ncbi:1-phosphatidylinositol 4-kinase [Aureococcus anophagefferens]|nr:1-phosphatidylinositol 4-kinase [Aureococcus anophagefferens]
MHVFLIDAWAQRSILGGRRKLEVKPWATVREVKNGIAKLLRIPPQRQQLRAPASATARAGPYFRSAELADHRTLEASGVHHSGATLLFDARPELTESDEAALEPVSCAALHGGDGALPPTLGRALLRARRALACFKPADEEPFCANNPRLFVGTAMPGTREAPEAEMRRGVRPGEAAKREVAAYLLDARNGGGAGVPETTLAKSRHRGYEYHDRVVADKVGSFQVYVPHSGVAEDFAPGRFETQRLQAIAALDMRCLNCDRNAANLLIPKQRRGAGKKEHDLKLVPIDHGFCLPEVLSIEWFDWCWIDWPALSAPVCEPLKAQIAQLDADDDAAALRDALDIRPNSYYTQSKPIAIDCAEAWRDEASSSPEPSPSGPSSPSSSDVGCAHGSPRWVDGLPSTVAPFAKGVPASPMRARSVSPTSDDDDGFVARFSGRAPPSARAAPKKSSKPPPLPLGVPAVSVEDDDKPLVWTNKSSEGRPLVRLHSCPSFADALQRSRARHADGQPLAPSASKPGIAASRSGLFSDGRVLGRRAKSADRDEYDVHFKRYLGGLLDDLVAWKLHRLNYPPLRS